VLTEDISVEVVECMVEMCIPGNRGLSLVMMLLMRCTLFSRRLEVQKVDRSLPAPVATKRRIDTASSAGTKLPTVKRSRPLVTTGPDKQLLPAGVPQSSDNNGLSGNSGKLMCKVEW
jgi:hypothetical protein